MNLAAGRQAAGDGPVGDCVSWASAEQVVRAAVTFDDVPAALAAADQALQLEPVDSPPAAMTRWKRGRSSAAAAARGRPSGAAGRRRPGRRDQPRRRRNRRRAWIPR